MTSLFFTNINILERFKRIMNTTTDMERKVMRQGPATLVVSLPSKWVKQYNVKKGRTVQVEEQGNTLQIYLTPHHEQKTIALNLSNTQPMTHRIVGALYKAGYDEMRLTYESSDEAKAILETVQVMQGHEVMKHEKNKIFIKRIMQEDNESFETIFRKCFHVLNDMAKDTLIALKENNKELMQQVILKDKLMAIFADYARRILLLGNKRENVAESYHIAVQIEKIADRLKYLCRHYNEEKEKPSNNIIQFCTKITAFLQSFEKLFYNFSIEKATEFGKERKKIQNFQKKIIKEISKKDIQAYHHCGDILSSTFDLNGPILEMHLKKN
jgi:phosphate uptake regulator